jgi:hypothetical protein
MERYVQEKGAAGSNSLFLGQLCWSQVVVKPGLEKQ